MKVAERHRLPEKKTVDAIWLQASTRLFNFVHCIKYYVQ